jgi:lipopolysaccharide transport system permease protein
MSGPAATTPARAPEGEGPRVVLHDHRPGVRELLVDSWNHRDLVPRIGIRVTIKGYSGTVLGRFWLFARPALSLFGMALLFGGVLNAPTAGDVPYVIFLLVGMLGWMAFERSAFWATRSFDVYRRLARGLSFPLLLVPTEAGMAAIIEMGVTATFLAVASVIFLFADGRLYFDVGPESAVAAAGFVLAIGHAWAIGLWTSVGNAWARDIRIIFRYILMIWMYATPVIYPPSALPASLSFLAIANPLAAPVEMVKYGLIGAGAVDPDALAVSLGWLVVVGALGLWFFARVAPVVLSRVQEDSDEGAEG